MEKRRTTLFFHWLWFKHSFKRVDQHSLLGLQRFCRNNNADNYDMDNYDLDNYDLDNYKRDAVYPLTEETSELVFSNDP